MNAPQPRTAPTVLDLHTEEMQINDLQDMVTRALEDLVLTPTCMAQQLRTYYGVFPQCLAAIIAREPLTESRIPLVANLWDAYGEGDHERSHRTLYDNFLVSLAGKAAIEQAGNETTWTTRLATDRLLECAHEAPMPEAVGMMLGLAWRAPAQMTALERFYGRVAVEAQIPVDLEFFTLHTADDIAHMQQLLQVARAEVSNVEQHGQVRAGIRQVISYDTMFWNAIGR